jgi:hypothetical protein
MRADDIAHSRFDDAVTHYHSALAFRPNIPLATELTQKALKDKEIFFSANGA